MHALPLDCDVRYEPRFLDAEEAWALFHELLENREVTDKALPMADGSEFISEVATHHFVDRTLPSRRGFSPLWRWSPWPPSLASVRDRIAALTGVTFPIALSIYYADGTEKMGFHTDLHTSYGPGSADLIASLSLGAARPFVFRSLSDATDRYRLTLEHGSLLVMGEHTQTQYEHALPACEDCTEPRLNLTFRTFDL